MTLTPKPSYPTYPPYHTGLYLEEYFFEFYQRNIDRFNKLKRKYIPIFWTNCYVNGVQEGWGDRVSMMDMQIEINKLDPNDSYFTVCQHDDAPMNPIPANTIIFSAGGNVTGSNVAPIPLICGPLAEKEPKEKTILASFVGSETHDVRNKMIEAVKDESDFYIATKGWEQEIKIDQFTDFVESSLKSKFVLCPRGYGATSFRLYEAMQLGAVPVYVSDRFWLPWTHELNWHEFCVIVPVDDVQNLPQILRSIDDETHEKMQRKIKEIYTNYFTLEGTCGKILQLLELENTL
jgi:glycosyltransferase involved in cell wall biosynthesis